MSRSLIRQLEQIRNTETYSDSVASITTQAVAEPTVSGSLEGDLNALRSLVKLVKGTTNWYDSLGQYFDPTNTTSGSATTKDMNLTNIKGYTTDAQTVIIAVEDNNSGSGYTVSGTSTGIMLDTGYPYATDTDRRGLPIFSSATGSYYDESGADRVVRIDVVNMLTDSEMQDSNGNTIYAKFHDAVDEGGFTSSGTAFARFYANGVPTDLSTVTGTLGTLSFVYPVRKVMSDVEEWEWQRTDFISSWEGDIEIIEDIYNLWTYTGASDGASTTAGSWSNTTGYYPFSGDPGSLYSAADTLNSAIGDLTFTEDNYISSTMTIAEMLDALDQQVKDNADATSAGIGAKYVEEVASDISAGVVHALPTVSGVGALTYTPETSAGIEGKNMDIYVGGQLLAADTSAGGDRDYEETTTSGVTFHFDVQAGRNITYVIRQ